MESQKISLTQILDTIGISIGFICSMIVVFWAWTTILSEVGLFYLLGSVIFFPLTLILAVPIVWILSDGFPVALTLIWILMWVAPVAGVLLTTRIWYEPPSEA